MGVPKEIREVPRPANTVVVDNGKEGPRRYAVRERLGVKYVPGGNPQPLNGSVIGYICDGKYVAKEDDAQAGPDMLSYGSSALVWQESRDIMDDLLDVYPIEYAYEIMAIASLKVIRPRIASNRYSTHYNRTFISRYYPGLPMSKNKITSFYQHLGEKGNLRKKFYRRRVEKVASDHHVAIDGMLKQDNSIVNDLSNFSYKSRVKGTKDVSVVYAFDIESEEIVCAEVFPGNCTDASAYADFIRDNGITKGIIVADKGFPPSKIKEQLDERPELHFLTPIKRNDVRISNNGMLDFEGLLKDTDSNVMFKKKRIQGGRYLYAYRDALKASLEEKSYLDKKSTRRDFDMEKYSKKDRNFGVIVFESDLDMDPETAYKCYDDRWMLELVFNYYKNDEGLDFTNVQNDFFVYGAEFVNSIATMITYRLTKRFRDTGLLRTMSYGDIMEDLTSAWRYVDAPALPSRGDGRWVHTLLSAHECMEALGISQAPPKAEPKKRGRPKKIVTEEKPKRPRGRPRKNPVSE